jgi:hypothetical protein
MQNRCTRAIAVASGLAVASLAIAQPDAGQNAEPVARFDGHKVLRVQIPSLREMRTAMALTDDVWSEHVAIGGALDIRVGPEQLAAIASSGLRYRVLVNDVQALIDQETADVRARRLMDDPAWYTNYHNYADVKTYVQALAAANPTMATYINLGASIQARDIFGITVTGPGNAAGRPMVVFTCCQHAREWITVPTGVYIAEQLLTQYATDPRVRFLLDNAQVTVIPIVNPDGYSYTWTNNRLWRKNRRPAPAGSSCLGVDLNRNWGHQWGGEGASTQPCNDTYRGASAMSETEVQRIRDYVQAHPEIVGHLDFHSYSQLVMSPWGWTAALPGAPDAAWFQAMDEAMADAIFSAFGKVYEPGPIYTTIYPASGTIVDWFYGARAIKSFTIEERDTGEFMFELPANQIAPTVEENYRAALTLISGVVPCYANCDGGTIPPILNVLDFNCFLNRFAAGDSYANCDGSTLPPVMNVLDFNCFLNRFAAGCE